MNAKHLRKDPVDIAEFRHIFFALSSLVAIILLLPTIVLSNLLSRENM